ncbi:MAG TPA: OmpA family protein [Thermoanaerobaculia bacterium]|nr:OmpA family protein [Thermoanaerobaculia bacterium]
MSLAVALLVLSPACKTKKKDVKPAVVPQTESAAPVVEAPPVQASETVEKRDDFVKDPPVVEETVPTGIEELNRWVRDKGYIRDAFYTYDEATLDDAAQSALSNSATWLKSKDGAGYSLLIEGHCDERGTEQYNLALGDRRANTAKDYLVTLGIDAGRIRTVSYGEERPFEEGHDDAAWAQNRRAHLVLVR